MGHISKRCRTCTQQEETTDKSDDALYQITSLNGKLSLVVSFSPTDCFLVPIFGTILLTCTTYDKILPSRTSNLTEAYCESYNLKESSFEMFGVSSVALS
jgi:hypothetical protein